RVEEKSGAGKTRIGPPLALDFSWAGWLNRLGVAQSPQYQGRHAAWSRDGRTLAWVDFRDHNVFVAQSEGFRPRLVAKNLWCTRVAISPDGALLAVSLFEGGLHILRVKDGQTVHKSAGHSAATFSPEGRRLVIATPGDFRFHRTDTWEVDRIV